MLSPEADEKTIKEIVARVLKVPITEIRLESRFKDDLAADSLDLILLLFELEDQMKLKLSDEEAKQVQTVADAVRLATQVAKQ